MFVWHTLHFSKKKKKKKVISPSVATARISFARLKAILSIESNEPYPWRQRYMASGQLPGLRDMSSRPQMETTASMPLGLAKEVHDLRDSTVLDFW